MNNIAITGKFPFDRSLGRVSLSLISLDTSRFAPSGIAKTDGAGNRKAHYQLNAVANDNTKIM